MTTLDNRGAHVSFSTRAGLDVRFDVGVNDAMGHPMDITSYTVIALLNDGETEHALVTNLVGIDTIAVHIDGALTATLPAVSRYSLELESVDGLRASILYGSVYCDGAYP